MRRAKHKSISRRDIEQVAKFRAELMVFAKLKEQGKTFKEAREIVWAEYLKGAAK